MHSQTLIVTSIWHFSLAANADRERGSCDIRPKSSRSPPHSPCIADGRAPGNSSIARSTSEPLAIVHECESGPRGRKINEPGVVAPRELRLLPRSACAPACDNYPNAPGKLRGFSAAQEQMPSQTCPPSDDSSPRQLQDREGPGCNQNGSVTMPHGSTATIACSPRESSSARCKAPLGPRRERSSVPTAAFPHPRWLNISNVHFHKTYQASAYSARLRLAEVVWHG